ncbi:arginine--tRNA ligase [Venenivibrio stagnispumantis]|uniref:Arginine--tRNA ligase n=1 Tax=Venenivibrio stagnispumantis TaxID=407998 RepID=A0AA46AEE1_9AQUI|nr:arginine--tRNA ligase [Venenivibrio stagnispumantis]MCW4573443.1 arginine--tRNA ligase [Venenivibrio stagnispumantis]SMP11882.1 arginyl-tRNA synthetase [Venenivibrio stagnispumantis]
MREDILNFVLEKIEKDIPEINKIREKVKIETPKEEKFGDFSLNIAFLLSKSLGKKPVEIANQIKEILQKEDIFKEIQVAGGGFINIFLSDKYYHNILKQINQEKEEFGKEKNKKGKINIEFVSANPTGPLHLGHGRGAVVGNVLSNLYEYAGYIVEREFYINDAGRQIRKLGESVYARFRQIEEPDYPFPEDGYHGEYIKDIAKELYHYEREKILSFLDEDEAIEFCSNYAKIYLLDKIKEDLKLIGVEFDIWYSEKYLYEHGKVEEALNFLKEKNLVYEKDGALWLKTTIYGDDKDRVLRKSDGEYTYFMGDIAYHYDKFRRNYDFIVNIWGADHHGYFPRLKAAVMAFGAPENWIRVLFIQLVKLFKNGEEIKMSKRAGEFITLRELVDEVGKDAVIYFFLTKDSNTHLNFDIDVALQKSNENPVFYVQYAHARICSVFREAKDRFGFDAEQDFSADLNLLKEDIEKSIMKSLAVLPEQLKEIAEKEQPHKITQLTYEIASKLHKYYYGYKFLVENDEDLLKARLFLLKAVRNALRLLFKLMGITPVERM